jgi:putative addiction module component (TIGR02574 family)
MTAAELTNQIMALPFAERVALAQEIWESIDDDNAAISPESDAEAIAKAKRRDHEMSRGDVPERVHDEVMENARRSIECE